MTVPNIMAERQHESLHRGEYQRVLQTAMSLAIAGS
jgi:hypothetical protein